MSGVGHAIGRVFKGVVGIIKKIWKPLLIAVAIYFTAGAAAAYFGAAEGATAFAEAAGTLGTEAAVGAGAAAAEAGTAAAVGAGAAEGGAAIAADIGAGAATDAAAGMTIGDAATGAVADAGLGAGGAGAGAAGSAIGDGTIMGGAGPAADLTESAASGAYPSLSLGQGADLTQTAASGGISSAPGQTSSWWQSSLDTAGKVMKTPGVMQMLSSGINSYQQGQMYNQNLKWMAAHAPGQIQGGVPQGVFGGFAQQGAAGTNPNVAGENVAAHGRVARVNTNSAQPDLPGGITADPRSLPGMNQAAATAPYPGYGTPGYGQQSPRSGPPPIRQQLAEQDPNQQAGILGGGEMPYVESPYDQSVV
jgi:hypothetical protein